MKDLFIIATAFLFLAIFIVFKHYLFALIILGWCIYLVWLYVINNSITLAYRAWMKRDIEQQEKYLLRIKDPNKLHKSKRPYYYFLKGILSYHLGNREESILLLSKCIESKEFISDPDAYLYLAAASMKLKRYEEASKYFNCVKQFCKSYEYNQDLINDIESELKQNLRAN
jgi:tetratricopeptide (TPR) repeat protein